METLTDIAKRLDNYVAAADTLINALATTIVCHEGDRGEGSEARLLQAQKREAAARHAYDQAREALVGPPEGEELDDAHNPL